MSDRPHTASVIAIASALMVTCASAARAQERPAPVAEVGAGWVGFADDGLVSESVVSGAGRWYLRPRVSIGPEIAYLRGRNHSHLMMTGNMTWDIVSSPSHARRLTPVLVFGAGVFQTRESFLTGTFTSHEGTFTAGGGVRARAGDRVAIGIDTRVGWELHLRITGLVGVRLGD